MHYGTTAGAVILIVWLLIGAGAAGQRGYFENSEANCGNVGSTLLTLVAGPLNYTGLNPEMECEAPQPSR